MEREILFAQTLEQVKQTAKAQSGSISEEQIKEAFAELDLKPEQLEMVYDYLKKYNIGLGEPLDAEEYLTTEEKDYLEEYLAELSLLQTYSEGEKEAITLSAMAGEEKARQTLIEIYLPQVADIAKLYAGQGVYLEDLVGEGNVALALSVQLIGGLEHAEEVQGALGKAIMDAMEDYIAMNMEEHKKDKRIAEKVNKVADAARELAEDLGRKITPEELSVETGMPVNTILDAMRMSGSRIEDIVEEAT